MGNCESCSIRKLNSFKSLTREELIQKSQCKSERVVKKGEVLFDEGDHVNGVYCIRKGVCKISKVSENGREQIIHLVKSGDWLGERNLISNECANLKSTAISDMVVCFIPGHAVMEDLKNNPNFTMGILKNMANALKETDNSLVVLGQKNVKQRLAHTLLYLENRFGIRTDGVIDVELSRENIAGIVGTTTESTIRILSEFKKKKLINLKMKEIRILDRKALEQVSIGT